MSIAIIGAGAIGSAIARNLARNGISASIANSRGPESLKALTDELGPHIKAVRETLINEVCARCCTSQ
ncbi:NAD(P)-binding domain-containing protein [Ralstonia pseudosolanacearum]|uniref:NAD(P)-binding domain-containing protein n=1 Tax=Ralstonia pseudosolanacearum TaxID=1310165 RepID=UPI001867D994|nr:NAD(P)-binding domain-containing protein [Ralstonia pseudosolanacearum]